MADKRKVDAQVSADMLKRRAKQGKQGGFELRNRGAHVKKLKGIIGRRITILVGAIEFYEGGNTLWVHSPVGDTVLRIRTMSTITTEPCATSPVSHADIITPDTIRFCLADDVDEAASALEEPARGEERRGRRGA